MAVDRMVVFFRHNNDIDHLTPIIYKWLDRSISPVEAVVFNNIDPRQDYRLRFLSNLGDFNVRDHCGEPINDKPIYKSPTSEIGGGKPLRLVKSFGRKVPSNTPEKIYNWFKSSWSRERSERLINKLIDTGERAVIVFDWPPEKGVEYNRVAMTVNVAQEMGHVCISLPHGANTFINAITTRKRFNILDFNELFNKTYSSQWDEVYSNWDRMNIFDYLVIPNKSDRKRAQDAVRSDKIIQLGLARYSSEWLSVLDTISPNINSNSPFKEADDGGLNIVFFLSPEKAFVSREMCLLTISMLSQVPQSKVALQNHPRSSLVEKHDISNNMGIDGDRIKLADSLDSASLIRWADVVLHTSSSVSFGPVVRDKNLLTLEYTHANRSILSSYLNDASMESLDEVHRTISSIKSNKEFRTYTKSGREEFISEVVKGGVEGDVLDKYIEFLTCVI